VVSGSRRVCIVDDDDGVRNSIRRLLEAYDLETTGYASGSDFLSHYRHCQFGCLILDIHLREYQDWISLCTLEIRRMTMFRLLLLPGVPIHS
jgi:FixJ family two-component response regulator